MSQGVKVFAVKTDGFDPSGVHRVERERELIPSGCPLTFTFKWRSHGPHTDPHVPHYHHVNTYMKCFEVVK